MTDRDEIIRMAKKSGFPIDRDGIPFVEHDDGECWKELQRFAALVAQAEREQSCRIVTGLCISDNNAREICEAIRARSKA